MQNVPLTLKAFLSQLKTKNNQKVQKSVAVLQRNLSVENAPKLSAKYLQVKTCKIKQMQNIPLTLRAFLNQLKPF